MGYLQLEIPELSIAGNISYYSDPNTWPSDRYTSMISRGNNCLTVLGSYVLFNNGLLKITINTRDYNGHIRGNSNNSVVIENVITGDYQEFGLFADFADNGYLAIAYNEDASVHNWGLFVNGTLYYYLSYWDNGYTTFSYNNINIYNAIVGSVPVLYNWKSVPIISGKNGILSLAQIKEEYINDGESVSGASADHFTNLSTENRVDVLIDDALPAPEIGGTTVTVKYTIPSLSTGSYEYCKLVAKKNSMPEGPEDGDKIINIDPTSTSTSVKYLRGSTKYYFEIFVKTADGYEAVSNVKSITTGETTDIMLFTNEFNEDILPEGWSLSNYKSGYGNANSNWGPQQFSSDYLSAYNFLIGNASRRMMYIENGELVADQATGMTDTILWIPVQRSIVPEEFKLEFDGKVSPTGYSSYDYNYTGMCVGCVDENNGWHQSAQASGVTGNDFTHYEANIANWTYGYIDYIGLSCCDGKPHFKNIQVTVG